MAATTGRQTNDPVSKSDPLLTFMFALQGEIPDPDNAGAKLSLNGYFTEISGPKEECEVVTLKTVGFLKNERGAPKNFKLPGRRTREPITLKRGLTSDMTFWKWWQLVKKGKMADAKTNISIIMYNRNYEALVQWDLEGAWPHKIAAPDFQAGSSDFGVEEITLVYARLNFRLVGDTSSSQNGSDAGEAFQDLGEAMTGGIFDAG